MDNELISPPEEFVEQVRDALLHLYDLTYLQIHPLLAAIKSVGKSTTATCQSLRQSLLDAIGSLHPSPGVAAGSPAWRSYQILELRYIEGRDVDDVIDELALSRRQYYREHNRALQAVASLLWQRWQLADSVGPGGAVAASTPKGHVEDLARWEAEQLLSGERSLQIDPVEIIRGVRDLLRPLCTSRNVSLSINLAQRLPPLHGDRVALRQALLAVLTPVITRSGAGTVHVEVAHQSGEIVVRIHTGAPINLDECRGEIEECRPFVAALRGRCGVRSTVGRSEATEIWLSFPTLDRPMLLVVDNNQDFLTLVERYLEASHWDVTGVSDIDRAYAVAQQRRPQAILLDVILPGRDGWDLLMELKSTPSLDDIPVIVCSVLHKEEMATSLGATAYLAKPISQRQLLDTLKQFDLTKDVARHR